MRASKSGSFRRQARLFGVAAVLGMFLASRPAVSAGDGVLVPTGETACNFGAWHKPRGARETPVRVAPAEDAAILGTLPEAASEDTRYEYAILFELVAARDGWVKVKDANDAYNRDAGAPAREVFGGEGWIPSSAVGIGIQSGRGYAGPSASSQRILDFPHKWLTEVASIERILGCSGEWILLEVAIGPLLDHNGQGIPPEERKSLPGKAWFRGVCSNSVTTCDMSSVDSDDPPEARP